MSSPSNSNGESKRFVSRISHEIKSPLATIQDSAELLLAQLPGPLTDEQKHFLEIVVRSGKRLSSAISNILDLFCLETGRTQYHPKQHDLSGLLRMALEKLDGSGLQVKLDLPRGSLSVFCDCDRVVQIFDIVLCNGFNPSSPDKTLSIALKAMSDAGPLPEQLAGKLREEKKTGVAAIRLTGPSPIPVTDRNGDAERATEARETNDQSIGSAIVRNIVEAHHGAMFVEDSPQGIRTVYIVLGERRQQQIPGSGSGPAHITVHS